MTNQVTLVESTRLGGNASHRRIGNESQAEIYELSFHDNFTGQEMTRARFVREIERGNYPNYHVRDVNGFKTPVSNPDGKEGNNLG